MLNELEIYYIEFFNSFNLGYNSTPGGTERFERHGLQVTLENIQNLYNIDTHKVIVIDAYNFIKKYYADEICPANIYRFFKGTHLRYKNWIFKENFHLYEKELQNRKEAAVDRFTDKTIYRFYNESLQVCFFGLRRQFIEEYKFKSAGNVSSLINKKLKSYKK